MGGDEVIQYYKAGRRSDSNEMVGKENMWAIGCHFKVKFRFTLFS